MRTTDKLPNYRIYDRTGGGVTEDIYAETLEDAIEAGREWIEAGDWNSSNDGIYRTITLECCVREIVRYPAFDVDLPESLIEDLLLDPDLTETPVTCCVKPADEERLIAALEEHTGGKWTRQKIDADGDVRLEWTPCESQYTGEINEDATNEGDAHDCSGEYTDEMPSCAISEDGEHDWKSPHSLVGGLKENPGVWSNGGTCYTSKSVCACCGRYKTEVDKGSQCHPDETRVVIEIEDADEASLAWIMRRLKLPESIEIKGVDVSLEWDKSSDITDGDAELGRAIHTVEQSALDAGIADGPYDGETFEHEGIKFRLGSHKYETEDGETTCIATIYRVF